MNSGIIDVPHPLTLIGGGDCTKDDIDLAFRLAPACVAADGGADAALAANITPAAVIGDMDSISDHARAQIPADRMHLIAEQDSTDFDKCLRHVAAPLVVAVGFAGGQIDHTLATLHTLVVRCDRPVVVLAARDVIFLCPPRMHLPMQAGVRVSLFPFGRVTGTSVGLEWPIDGLNFAPGLKSGTSNRATGDVSLAVSEPCMLCILPRVFIEPVASMLLALEPAARWRARAG